MRKRVRFLGGMAVLLLVLALTVAACSSGSADDSGAESAAAVTPATEEPAAQAQTAEEPADQAVVAETPALDAQDEPEMAVEDAEEQAMATPAADARPTSINLTARDNFFDVQTIEATADTDFSVVLFNDGVLPHNIAFFTEEGGRILAEGSNGAIILEGETNAITFRTPGPGTYFFVCVVHPLQMTGEFIVS